MKLYTEEQVKLAYGYGGLDGKLNQAEYSNILEHLTPIELPSDEEILEKTSNLPIDATPYKFGLKYGFRDGAYWMKEQILNQNK